MLIVTLTTIGAMQPQSIAATERTPIPNPSVKPLDRSAENEIFVGVNVHPCDARTPDFEEDKYFDLIKEAGVKWIRVDITAPRWHREFEPFVEAAHARGIKVLAMLGPFIVEQNPNFTLADWESAVHDVIEIFGQQVDAWEVWNEPNLASFYLGYIDGSPEHYTNILKSTYRIVKAYRANVPVLFGGVAQTENCTGFITECWELGAANHCDVFNFHLYSIAQSQWLAEAAVITNPKPIWITETGANSLQNGTETQASRLEVLRTHFQENMAKYRIQKVFWYCWMDYAKMDDETNVFGQPTTTEDFYGLVTVDFKAKSVLSKSQN
jgi:hypothetical protein